MLCVVAPVDHETVGTDAVKVKVLPWQIDVGPEAAMLMAWPLSVVTDIVSVISEQDPP
jgi:hypothetical protein